MEVVSMLAPHYQSIIVQIFSPPEAVFHQQFARVLRVIEFILDAR